ncbi:MAG: Z1 domain-containing protein [Gammaproteobacteria bacterium]|nr:Z1 domain-containing protein [Gammaproteobacteria bacterium]
MSDDSPFGGFTAENAVDLLMQALKLEVEPTPAEVEAEVDKLLTGLFAALRPYRQAIIDDVLKRIRVRVGVASVLSDDTGHIDWLPGVDRTQWEFWPRLERYLRRADELEPAKVLELDRSTDKTLELLESPLREGRWDRRGLVVGHVQSGKTSHYTALSAKALDAGYQIIIILAGVHNSLRAQTHERIDEYLIGRDSAALLEAVRQQRTTVESGQRIGVSDFDLKRGVPDPLVSILTCTNSNDTGDFKTAVATQVGLQVGAGSRLVMVVKKNATILRNLVDWMRLQNAAPGTAGPDRRVLAPTLVIDDEADHASINTKDPDQDPTTINRLIRELLMAFDRVSLVGYTATPFANIFIPLDVNAANPAKFGDDLFPRSFIVNLKPPSDYIGPDRVFGHPGDESINIPERPPLPMFVPVADAGIWMPDKHKKDHYPGTIPRSLQEAVRLFVLVCAARAARGNEQVHNSMLVHATRFVNVQSRVAEQIEVELNALRNVLSFAALGSSQSERQKMKDVWDDQILQKHEEFRVQLGDDCPSLPAWDDVWKGVDAALRRITVMRVNGTSADALKYSKNPEGVYVIAIGGDKLSRGLTLEGLSVSYFLRTSNMFDTLLQMGRWFGYRPGYLDLCRVHTTPTLYAAFREIALAMEDLRADLDLMAETKKTPVEFGLRVRTPQDGLVITSANKIRRGDPVQVRFADSIIQTLEIPRKGDQAGENRAAVRTLIEQLGRSDRKVRGDASPHYLWHNIGVDKVLEFLSRYEAFSTPSFFTRCTAIRNYIRQQVEKGELTGWTVAVVSKRSSPRQVRLGAYDVNLVERGKDSTPAPEDRLRMRGVVGSEEEALDLSPAEYAVADRARASKGDDAPKFRETVRNQRPAARGLLLIYPVKVRGEDLQLGEEFIPAVAISFPASQTAQPLSYTVNDVWKKQYGLIDDPDDYTAA